jgi:hypothetical protein
MSVQNPASTESSSSIQSTLLREVPQQDPDAWQRLEQLPDHEPKDDRGSDTSQITASPLHRALELVRNDFGETTWQAFWRVAGQRHTAAEWRTIWALV